MTIIGSDELYAADHSVLGATGVAMGRGLSREQVVAAIMRRVGVVGTTPNAVMRGASASRLTDKMKEPSEGDTDSDETSDSTSDDDETSDTSSDESTDSSSDETSETDNDVEERAKGKKLVSHAKLRKLAAAVTGKTPLPNAALLATDEPGRKLLRASARLDAIETERATRATRALRQMTDDPDGITRAADDAIAALADGREVDVLTLDAARAVARGRAKAAMGRGSEVFAQPTAEAVTREIHRQVVGGLRPSPMAVDPADAARAINEQFGIEGDGRAALAAAKASARGGAR